MHFDLMLSLQWDYYPAEKGEDSQREQEGLGSPVHHMSAAGRDQNNPWKPLNHLALLAQSKLSRIITG